MFHSVHWSDTATWLRLCVFKLQQVLFTKGNSAQATCPELEIFLKCTQIFTATAISRRQSQSFQNIKETPRNLDAYQNTQRSRSNQLFTVYLLLLTILQLTDLTVFLLQLFTNLFNRNMITQGFWHLINDFSGCITGCSNIIALGGEETKEWSFWF